MACLLPTPPTAPAPLSVCLAPGSWSGPLPTDSPRLCQHPKYKLLLFPITLSMEFINAWPVLFLAIFMDSHKTVLGTWVPVLKSWACCLVALCVSDFFPQKGQQTLTTLQLGRPHCQKALDKKDLHWCLAVFIGSVFAVFFRVYLSSLRHRPPQCGTRVCGSVQRALRIFQKCYRKPSNIFFSLKQFYSNSSLPFAISSSFTSHIYFLSHVTKIFRGFYHFCPNLDNCYLIVSVAWGQGCNKCFWEVKIEPSSMWNALSIFILA